MADNSIVQGAITDVVIKPTWGILDGAGGETSGVNIEKIITDIQALLEDEFYDKSEIDTALAGKQNTLIFDDTPVNNSNNPVKSSGIYNALADKADVNHNHDSRYYTETEIDTALAAKADNSIIAGEFDDETAYVTGDIVVYEGSLYRFTSDHAAGAWDSTEVAEIIIVDELGNKADITDLDGYLPLTGGTVTGIVKSNDSEFDVQTSAFDSSSNPESDRYPNALNMFDAGNARRGYVAIMAKTNGRQGVQFKTQRVVNGSNIYHGIQFLIDASGNRYVVVDDSDSWRTGIGAVNKSGDTITGNLTRKSTDIDASKANNNVSSTQYPTECYLTDSSNRTLMRLEGDIYENGNIGSYWYVRNYDTSGAIVATKGIKFTMNKSGTLTYTISDPSKFASAIGAVQKAGDTMSDSLVLETTVDRGFHVKATDLTLGSAPSAARWLGGFCIKDKDNKNTGYYETYVDASGNIYGNLVARNRYNNANLDNYIRLFSNVNGTRTVSLSVPDAWRTALSLVPDFVKNDNTSAVSVEHDTLTDVASITLSAGYWIVGLSAEFASNSTGYRYIEVSGAISGYYGRASAQAVNGRATDLHIVWPYHFTASSSTVTLRARHTRGTGTTLNVTPRIYAIRVANF